MYELIGMAIGIPVGMLLFLVGLLVNKMRKYVMQEDPMRPVAIRLTNWHIRAARKLGDGAVSEGVRYALEMTPPKPKEET